MVTPPLPWRDSGKTVCGQPISQYARLTDAHHHRGAEPLNA